MSYQATFQLYVCISNSFREKEKDKSPDRQDDREDHRSNERPHALPLPRHMSAAGTLDGIAIVAADLGRDEPRTCCTTGLVA